MYRSEYTTDQILEKETGDFDSHNEVKCRVEGQSFGEDNFGNQVHQKMKVILSLIWMNNRSSLDGGILPQNPENLPLNPENYANIPAVETTTQFTSF